LLGFGIAVKAKHELFTSARDGYFPIRHHALFSLQASFFGVIRKTIKKERIKHLAFNPFS